MTQSKSTNEGEALPDEMTETGDIAIIGVAGRFPGAADCERFWANVRDGISAVRRLSDDELLAAGVSPAELSDPHYVKMSPVLDDIDKFDAGFFGMSPRDASVMDPAHRIFLEVAWEAVENSGNSALPNDSTVGVFGGSGAPLYWMLNVRTQPDLMRTMGEFLVRHTGNDMNFLATRVSYEFDLRGPSLNVQTACSSALVAVHLARQSLLAGECNMALAGGSTILVPSGVGYHYKEGEILSPDGHCRPFDANSAGTIFGSGAGCLVLKRLNDALDNGDNILAVIKGSAINNDGAVKVGYLAPSVEGQALVIAAALENAKVPAESISYIEAHGTGTLVGDPIELTGLQQAFSSRTEKKQFCAVGSVKSNIGHLGEAAAAASLIKVIFALKHRQLPPSLGYQRPNPAFDFADSAFFINDRLRPWTSAGPLRAGITALGAGGTNCHVILEEAPPPIPGEGDRACQLLVLSAKSRAALDRMGSNLATHLETTPDLNLADAAYTLSLGRRAWPYRRALVASDREEAVRLLRGSDEKRVVSGVASEGRPEVVFTFPGGGAQYARMGIDLYESEPAYREAMDECLSIIDGTLTVALRPLLFATPDQAASANLELKRPSLSLPALFATEYALAKTFYAWGIQPVALVGHSMGEYTAACLAGVFTLKDALRLVMTRGRLFETVARGGMVGVSLSHLAVQPLLAEGLSIAAVNAPDLCVVSGPVDLIRQLEAQLSERAIDWTPIHIDIAAHSSMLDPILAEFRRTCEQIRFSAPRTPFTSNLTGTWITEAQVKDPGYWVAHLRNAVQFAGCAETAMSGGERIFLEIGPGRTLTTLVQAQRRKPRGAANSLRHPQEPASDFEYAQRTLGKVWTLGGEVDWTAFFDGQLRNRVPLPSYPFEKSSFWIQPGKGAQQSASSDLEAKRENTAEWFHTIGWIPFARPLKTPASETTWLVLLDDSELAQALPRALVGRVISARSGSALKRRGELAWEFNPSIPEQYTELLETLDGYGLRPDHVVSFGPSHAPFASSFPDPAFEANRSFFQVISLARAMATALETAKLTLVTERAIQLPGEQGVASRALAFGPVQVIPREFPGLITKLVDVVAPRPAPSLLGRPVPLDKWARKLGSRWTKDTPVDPSELAKELAAELGATDTEQLVALRSGQRFVRRVIPMPLRAPEAPVTWVTPGATILVTGGVGGIGLQVAVHLARQGRVKLALLTRRSFPAPILWAGLASGTTLESATARRLLEIQELGSQVVVVAGDVSQRDSLNRALAEIRTRFGPLQGVIHAAGVMDDAPMQERTREAMESVLAPKVSGTLNLDALIPEPLDFFVVFSSVASLLGLPGQVDYSAANAFLDAFAIERALRAPGRTLAINWNAWRDVGMVEKALRPSSEQHPGVLEFRVEDHWLLSEHRIQGSLNLLPGTGLLELARAAFCERKGEGPVELSSVTLVAPFQVAPGTSRGLKLDVNSAGDITCTSSPSGELHLTASGRSLTMGASMVLDLSAVRARCTIAEEQPPGGFLVQSFVDFGPRWGNIERVLWGNHEALIECCLPEAFKADLENYWLHPAMLDMATGGAQRLIPGFSQQTDFYVPLGYENVRVFRRLPQRFASHVRCLPNTGNGLAFFDVTLTDTAGSVLVEIERFTMKRVSAQDQIVVRADPALHESDAVNVPIESGGQRSAALRAVLRTAIAPAEGLAALDTAITHAQLSQIVISSVDVNSWRTRLDAESASTSAEGSEGSAPLFQRPDLPDDYVEPSGPLEQGLASIWSKLLGVQQVGAADDFFALGGNSLVAVRLFARIKKDYSVALPISTLYQAPTVRAIAALLTVADVKPQSPQGEAEPFFSYQQLATRYLPAFARGNASPDSGLLGWTWEQAETSSPPASARRKETWLVLLDGAGVGMELCRRLRRRGDTVIQVYDADAFHKVSDAEYSLSPEQGRSGFDRLFTELKASKRWPDHVVMLWPITLESSFRPGSNFFHRVQERGFFSLLFMTQALADQNVVQALSLTVATNGACSVLGEALVYPSKATVFGPCRAIATELPFINSRIVDLVLPPVSNREADERVSEGIQELAGLLESEAQARARDELVAFRQGARYVWSPRGPQSTRASVLPAPSLGGTYLVTVGSDAASLCVLQELAVTNSQLTVVIPTAGRGLAIDVDTSSDTRLAAALARLKTHSRGLLVCRADISNLEQMQAVKVAGEARFGRIEGVFHSASAADGTPVQLQTAERIDHVLAPRIQGALVLESLFGGQPLEFVAYCAELAAWSAATCQGTAGAGLAYYVALASAAASNQGGAAKRTIALLLGPRPQIPQDAPPLSSRMSSALNEVAAGPSRIVILNLLPPADEHPPAQAPVVDLKTPRPPKAELAAGTAQTLEAIWRDATGLDVVDLDTDLRRAGVVEVGIARVMTHVKATEGAHQSVAALCVTPTIRSTLAAITRGPSVSETNAHHFKHVVAIHPGAAVTIREEDSPNPERLPFFLVAGMYGNILNLRHLGHLVGHDREVYGIQARGLYGDEAPHTALEEMAEAYINEVRVVQPHGPYVLGGFSGGGLTALEMAKRLKARGEQVSLLVMLDTPTPDRELITPRDRAMLQLVQFRRKGAAYVSEWAQSRIRWELRKVQRRFGDEVEEEYTPHQFKSDAIGKAFIRATETYEVPSYDSKLVLFRPELDRYYQVGPNRWLTRDRKVVFEDNNWSKYARDLEVFEVPGDHDSMVLEPGVRVLAERLRACLERADQGNTPTTQRVAAVAASDPTRLYTAR